MAPESYRSLTAEEIGTLASRNCHADDWGKVLVSDPFDPGRIYGVIFHGEVRLGRLDGTVRTEDGNVRSAGIYRATLEDCTLGDNVLINEVNGYISNYHIASGAMVQGIGKLAAGPEAAFGNGVVVVAVNEGGGRGIPMFEGLSAQLAHIMALHRYRPGVLASLEAMVAEHVAQARAGRATVGEGAVVRSVPQISDVRIGPGARVIGAASLSNGTILSEPGAPTFVGSGVVASDFMIGEGSNVSDGAILERTFVGQGVQVGKHYSAENSLFFANSECFHGEGCSIFGGPYTVSHHKSTLMIAGVFSFFNAGSGSNQSNHMYKLGPIHQGVIERGSKTGSFSYLLWPCRIGPFSVVIGKHMNNFDLGELPFSYIDAGAGDRTYVVPGMNLLTVGTTRDGAKWPARDRRTASIKRDLIVFDVLSPYTVGRMLAGEAICGKLYKETPRDVKEVARGGGFIRRLLLRSGEKAYRTGVEMYLLDKVFSRAEAALAGAKEFADLEVALGEDDGAVYDGTWVDISGLLTPRARIEQVEAAIESGELATLEAVDGALRGAFESYQRDEWSWVRRAYADRFGKSPDELSPEELAAASETWVKARSKFIRLVLADAEKEYDQPSRIGFGADGPEAAREADFQAVRGTYDTDRFVRQLNAETEEARKRAADFKTGLARLS
ncbi:MAG: DUF4954 family protein [Planctomycetota bacterium]|jgi:hypothetical protein